MEVEAIMRYVGSGDLLFMGDVTIDGMFTLHGCKILRINNKTVYDLPSIRRPGGWERPVHLPPPVMEEVRKVMFASAKEAALLGREFSYAYRRRGDGGTVVADVTATHLGTGAKLSGIRLCRGEDGNFFVGYPYETLPNGRKRLVFELLGEAKRDFEENLIYEFDMEDVMEKTGSICQDGGPEAGTEAPGKEETGNVGRVSTDRRDTLHSPGSGSDDDNGRQPDREHTGPGRKGDRLRR